MGPIALGLDLPIARWATDGVLAMPFFAVGLEFKRETVDGHRPVPRGVVPVTWATPAVTGPAPVRIVVTLTSTSPRSQLLGQSTSAAPLMS